VSEEFDLLLIFALVLWIQIRTPLGPTEWKFKDTPGGHPFTRLSVTGNKNASRIIGLKMAM